MARIRSIKPEFWTSAQVAECSTNARLLFIGLWNFCDDEGRHPLNCKQIKMEVFPSDDFSADVIRGMLAELSENDLIRQYSIDGKEYFYVTGWKHQRIDKRQPAKYPAPEAERSTNTPRTLPPDTIGEDRKGEDRKDGAPSAPNGFDPLRAVFDDGLKYLRSAGIPERHARGLLGKWRKTAGDGVLIEVLADASRKAVSEPVAWVEKAIRARASPQRRAVMPMGPAGG